MIEPTDEMVAALKRIHREQFQFGVLNLEQTFRKGLAAVLALVERDWNLQPNPAAPKSRAGRGVNHPHYCVSCSDGETKGSGCMNCRQTGFDQTPWPQCTGCATPPQ